MVNEITAQSPDNNKFKIILEYFVLHMCAMCTEKKTKYRITDTDTYKKYGFNYNNDNISFPLEFTKSGHGYQDNSKLQKQLEEKTEIKETNSFTILEKQVDQKICISIDATMGYKKGSYLHWVDTENNNEAFTHHSNGTNINPIFEKDGDTDTFVGIEVGPSQNSPTFVFPPLYYTFNELGLFNNNANDQKKKNLETFFEYFKEMRRYELKGGLTYKGEQQLLATKNMILTGAPGTGKTWSAKNIASWMICGKPFEELSPDEKQEFIKQHKFVQFHPSYDYSDFVEGLRPIKTENQKSDKATQRFRGQAPDSP